MKTDRYQIAGCLLGRLREHGQAMILKVVCLRFLRTADIQMASPKRLNRQVVKPGSYSQRVRRPDFIKDAFQNPG